MGRDPRPLPQPGAAEIGEQGGSPVIGSGNRSLRAAAAGLLVAGLVLAGCGGGDDEPEAAGGEAPVAEVDAGPAANSSDEALALLEEWAEPLRLAGFAIGHEGIADQRNAQVISGLTIGGPEDVLGVSWSVSTARISQIDADQITLVPSVEQSVNFTANGMEMAASFTAETVEITSLASDGDGNVQISLRFSAVSFPTGPGDATADTMTMQIGSRSGGDGDPSVSAARLALSDIVIPENIDGALGHEIDSLIVGFAPDAESSGEVMANSLEIEWGTLRLTGSGGLGFDEMGRPTGLMDAEIVDILAVLDAFYSAGQLDRDLLADTYSALLEEMSVNGNAESVSFPVAIENGAVVLRGESRGLQDIVLGNLPALFVPNGAN